jgi:hypothetical protein
VVVVANGWKIDGSDPSINRDRNHDTSTSVDTLQTGSLLDRRPEL